MKDKIIRLTQVGAGKKVVMAGIEGGLGLRRRLSDMGLHEGMEFQVLHSRCSGPCVILAGQTRLVIGGGMAQKVMVREV